MLLPACSARLGTLTRKLDNADVSTCALFNRLSYLPRVRSGFRIISRLGDGILWYAVMALMPIIGGYDGAWISLHMAATAFTGLAVYKLAKRLSGRERPYVQHADRVACAMPPLDRYSFPSGHTLHAVSFTMVLYGYIPEMLWILLPFALLVALSRMILGLHYPSDVLAGALIGATLAIISFNVFSLPATR